MDRDERTSRTCEIDVLNTDAGKALFASLEAYVEQINAANLVHAAVHGHGGGGEGDGEGEGEQGARPHAAFRFALLKKDLTYIRYDAGGFFKAH